MNDESTPKGAHEIPAPASIGSIPPSPLPVTDAAWLAGFNAAWPVADQLGFNRGHIAGWDFGFEAGRLDERTTADAAHSAELDAHNRWIARTIPAAVETRARRVAVSA